MSQAVNCESCRIYLAPLESAESHDIRVMWLLASTATIARARTLLIVGTRRRVIRITARDAARCFRQHRPRGKFLSGREDFIDQSGNSCGFAVVRYCRHGPSHRAAA